MIAFEETNILFAGDLLRNYLAQKESEMISEIKQIATVKKGWL